MFEIQVKYPDYRAEYRIAESLPLVDSDAIQPVFSPADVLRWQQRVLDVPVPPHVIHYAVRLVRSTRVHEGENPDFVYEWVSQGASPRAVYQLALAAKVPAPRRQEEKRLRRATSARLHIRCSGTASSPTIMPAPTASPRIESSHVYSRKFPSGWPATTTLRSIAMSPIRNIGSLQESCRPASLSSRAPVNFTPPLFLLVWLSWPSKSERCPDKKLGLGGVASFSPVSTTLPKKIALWRDYALTTNGRVGGHTRNHPIRSRLRLDGTYFEHESGHTCT